MKRIEIIDKALETRTCIEGIGNTFIWSYMNAIKTKNELMNLGGFIWDRSTEAEFIKNLDQFEITDITVSDQSTGLMETLKNFCDNGWSITGMTEINGISINWETGEHKRIPAIKLHKN